MEDGFMWPFLGFYGDPPPCKRVDSWDLLHHLLEVYGPPWVCERDFNELLCLKEKMGGSDKSFSGMFRFKQAIQDCDLVDLGYSGPRLTWNNRRDGKSNILERLDMYLADRWSELRFKNLIGRKTREIEHLYKSCENDGEMTSIKILENSMEKLLECEEIFWKQRSRAKCLAAGDRNSKYFHDRATARKKTNAIDMLIDHEGRP
ncbi:hypothetical protein Dsin_019207 [Dipteronia sinensis]|uniref:Uncharacterized protein n=1 Tax=Dipteronia sinensis TaxID=43782 RepID=A0AAE0A6X1_9ROSI|nr:hypothetical protein Dsin_019207 [Dipteronia sinensis]